MSRAAPTTLAATLACALALPGCLFDWARFGPAHGDAGTGADGDAGLFAELSQRAQACRARPAGQTTVVPPGTRTMQYRVEAPPDDHTYVLDGVQSTASPGDSLYPIAIGDDTTAAPRELCILGGSAVGQQDVGVLQPTIPPGAGLSAWGANGYVIDGFRAYNLTSGLSLHSERVYARNLYFRYMRGACLRDEHGTGGIIADSLFDGCWYGLRLELPAGGEPLVFDRVLLRLQPMPTDDNGGSYDCYDGSGQGHAGLFRFGGDAGRLTVRDSILMVEKKSVTCDGSMDFPAGMTAERVVLVWLGGGSYPGSLPPGVTVTDQRSVWDEARADWLRAHGNPTVP